ncbi:hypothetical protein MA16_Dca005112 [Dendrobium catenatum]|uniref:Uncharacterized protein n=1 Tax=Dendrobium catenatum TaxID=906689 RepID=A0A2I0VL99_9ASPA|nr:hypothetical protein MA16_Dca005112 [Dendrobium catenatum]
MASGRRRRGTAGRRTPTRNWPGPPGLAASGRNARENGWPRDGAELAWPRDGAKLAWPRDDAELACPQDDAELAWLRDFGRSAELAWPQDSDADIPDRGCVHSGSFRVIPGSS